MATTYKTPGAYIEEIPKLPPSVAPVDTAVPAFIGYTEKATDEVAGDLLLKPKRIESLVEFEQYFGGPQDETGLAVTITTRTTAAPGAPIGVTASVTVDEGTRSKHILYYALQMFYANGGKSCFIVSVGGFKAVAAALDVDELQDALEPLSKVDEPTLIVIPEAQSLPIADYAALQNAALAQCNDLKDRFVIMDVHGDDESLSDPDADLIEAVANFRTAGPGQFLKYGAAYAPNLSTILDYAYDEAGGDVDVTHIVDGAAPVTTTLAAVPTNDLRERAIAAIRAKDLVLPPSGAIAGVFAKVDNDRGVWKAPANVPLVAVVRPTIELGNVQNDAMNVDPTAGKSVNAIRPFVGKGTLVWGARTLAGNDNEWRYVNVRRFFTFVEESVKKATDQFTFEPNDANTWVKVQAMIENFLTTQWRAGALQGIKPEHAFYVAVGLGKTMTPLDILEGRMILQIGMAAVRPAEFIVLRFSHKMAES
ncbi:phage tail sheath family protein [Nocardioides sp.]|uniref:phage tail sheath family protein n=1 Tax=Nocardioides sp. TaxID=35761 RepID=UPI0035B2CCA8